MCPIKHDDNANGIRLLYANVFLCNGPNPRIKNPLGFGLSCINAVSALSLGEGSGTL